MKLANILSASVLAVAVLLSATTCKPSENNGTDSNPDVSTSATATPSTTGTASATANPAPVSAGEAGTAGEVRVSAPTEVNISDVTTNSIVVSWKTPNNTIGKIVQYNILLKENGEVKGTYSTTETNYPITGLASNNAYMVEVSATAVSEDGSAEVTSAEVPSNTVVVRSPELNEQPETPNTPVQQPAGPVNPPAAGPEKSAEVPAVNERNSAAIKKILETANGYYRFVGSTDSLKKVKEAGKVYDSDSSEAALKKFVTDFPEGFRYFDTSSSEKVTNAYSQLFARATQSERTPGAVVTVPSEAVTVDGDKAIIDSAKVLVTVNSKARSGTEAPYFENPELSFVKKADGSWVMIAESPRQSIP